MKTSKRFRVACAIGALSVVSAANLLAPRAGAQTGGCTDQALTLAEQKLTNTIAYTSTSQFPEETNPANGNKWNLDDASHWTSGFFPGWIWWMYENTLSDSWMSRAQAQTASMSSQETNASDHDLGFKILGSYGNQYRIMRDPVSANVIQTAAQAMTTLWRPGAGVIESWPNYDSYITVIIDNMMNLELLFEGAQLTGNSTYYNMAVSHALKTMQNQVRPDGSTYHVVDYNTDGSVQSKFTVQGAGTETTWSRGQAWAIYGFTMTYRFTKDPRFLATAQGLADYFINNLPSDFVPYWDFSQCCSAPRDSSAAAIAAAGLLELSTYVATSTDQQRYYNAARNIQASLSSAAYLADLTASDGILLHGSANVPGGDYDKSLIYGDYYFIQGCFRAKPLPPAPANLTAARASATQINLGWDAEPGAIRYNVKRSTTSGGPYSIIAPPPIQTANNFSDTGVTGATNYFYVVSATNVAGEGPNSAEVSVLVTSPGPSISSLSPTHAPAGAAFTLTVNGFNFTSTSVVNVGGKPEPTTFAGSAQLVAATPSITVTDGGNVSSAVSFTIDDFSLAGPTAPVTVSAGASSAIKITATPINTNGFADSVAFSVSGLPAGVTAAFSPTSLTPGVKAASTTMTITASAQSGGVMPTAWHLDFKPLRATPGLLYVVWACLFLFAFSFSLRQQNWRDLAHLRCTLLLMTVAAFAGCATSSTRMPPKATSPLTAEVTVTATSGTDTKTTTLTLAVQ
jgi:hypothetical protein